MPEDAVVPPESVASHGTNRRSPERRPATAAGGSGTHNASARRRSSAGEAGEEAHEAVSAAQQRLEVRAWRWRRLQAAPFACRFFIKAMQLCSKVAEAGAAAKGVQREEPVRGAAE